MKIRTEYTCPLELVHNMIKKKYHSPAFGRIRNPNHRRYPGRSDSSSWRDDQGNGRTFRL